MLSRVTLNNVKLMKELEPRTLVSRCYSVISGKSRQLNDIVDQRQRTILRQQRLPSIVCLDNKKYSTEIDNLPQPYDGFVSQLIAESTPVDLITKFMVTLNQTCGLPWWASIAAVPLILKVFIIPTVGKMKVLICFLNIFYLI